ncbi:hypothetical protein ABL78_1488 [Leptomonas seymouri]|uniref:Uncharacterized protein n=1 Tax=Leptomonas seymouri TaxID=5684 RepID=A0A0N1PDY3_LEPSE|nr:hypothetical protein ABL78_1488 [Leptomonas seymouri]|eukprot:KPI89362.1 hypothetical protein ABL78_1488 [Leptomonas seymouri]
MRKCRVLGAAAARQLTPGSLLTTIRNDPGMTAVYYANRYYGKENVMQLNHMLWGVLKLGGKVDIDRADGADEPPRWYPLFATPRRHYVRHHNADEEDLSLLRQPPPPTAPPAPTMPSDEPTNGYTATATASSNSIAEREREEVVSMRLESTIVGMVEAFPGQDIQFYISEMPVGMQRRAPAAFKRLREAGLLERQVTAKGTYVWH